MHKIDGCHCILDIVQYETAVCCGCDSVKFAFLYCIFNKSTIHAVQPRQCHCAPTIIRFVRPYGALPCPVWTPPSSLFQSLPFLLCVCVRERERDNFPSRHFSVSIFPIIAPLGSCLSCFVCWTTMMTTSFRRLSNVPFPFFPPFLC